MPDYNPTFLKRDPITGLLFYDFDGHINADGVDLDVPELNLVSQTFPPPVDAVGYPINNQVRWLWNGSTDGFLLTYHDGNPERDRILIAMAKGDSTASQGQQIRLMARASDGKDASLTVTSYNSPGRAGKRARIDMGAGAKGARLLDSDGLSSFLKLAADQDWRMSCDAASLTFAANNDTSLVVPHGLGVSPRLVLLTPQVGGTQAVTIGCTQRDVTNFTITASTWNRANASYTFGVDWLAIG